MTTIAVEPFPTESLSVDIELRYEAVRLTDDRVLGDLAAAADLTGCDEEPRRVRLEKCTASRLTREGLIASQVLWNDSASRGMERPWPKRAVASCGRATRPRSGHYW